MRYNYKYRIFPEPDIKIELVRHIDICRQVYNHFLHVHYNTDDPPSRYEMQAMLPDMKEWWDDLSEVYSKVLQMVVKRVDDNLVRLRTKRQRGYSTGRLKWKSPREYRSLTYNQVGFDLKNTRGRPMLKLPKIGNIPIRLHRPLPNQSSIKQVSIKQEATGEWFAIFGIKISGETPTKPESPQRIVGIDVGVQKFSHDTDGIAVKSIDLSEDEARLKRAQRRLARKQHGSANWEKQRRKVAACQLRLKRKRRDFLHKLSNYYAREFDFVAVEKLDVKGLIEQPGNSRNRASASWNTFFRMLKYKCEREGTHYVAVSPAGTTTECAVCGIDVEKSLDDRVHRCQSCGFVADRDANAAWNILSRGLAKLGVGHSEVTPVETPLPVETIASAGRILKAGSPHPSIAETPKNG